MRLRKGIVGIPVGFSRDLRSRHILFKTSYFSGKLSSCDLFVAVLPQMSDDTSSSCRSQSMVKYGQKLIGLG